MHVEILELVNINPKGNKDEALTWRISRRHRAMLDIHPKIALLVADCYALRLESF